MESGIQLEQELGERLRRIYGLDEAPITPQDFFRLLKSVSRRLPGIEAFIERVKSGEAIIGKCNHETKYALISGVKTTYVFCAYDALVTTLLRSEGTIAATCPHCGVEMQIRVHEGLVEYSSPNGIVFWWGAGPLDAPGNPICDHIHFFPSRRHLAVWLRDHPDELGFALSLEEAKALLANRS